MQYLACVMCILFLTIVFYSQCTDAIDEKDLCSTCRRINDNFAKGLEDTAKKNFGGGNTDWEERRLSKYETSEIRLVEILENLCDSSSFECNQMVEEHEEHFENWWFKKKEKYPDLFKWFCIDTIEVCCPKGTFGPDCNACIGGSERPCHGNGACDGDGTRRGSGKCSCHAGYEGEFCLDCAAGFYNEERNDTFSLCTECHNSCKTCKGPTNTECDECKPGWSEDDEGACNDVDECSNETSPCEENQYCLNTEGSFSCKACDRACASCTKEGSDNCVSCAPGYNLEDGKCTDVDECNLPDKVCLRENEECTNTQGSYKCFCSNGFEDKDGVCVKTEETENSDSSAIDSSKLSTEGVHEDL
ncbi:cysteine-rich with EGF-like domain protein 2 [Lepisosteus oculatus]|nr:PREDICTED: cysteine-rich with EGF-like domain protein 2 [Lepisosteus oculatus]